MARIPKPKFVEIEGEYYHVRFRDPGDFSEIRTPTWATDVAQEVCKDSKVRMGKRKGSEGWAVQSVLVPKEVGKAEARKRAEDIIEKIES